MLRSGVRRLLRDGGAGGAAGGGSGGGHRGGPKKPPPPAVTALLDKLLRSSKPSSPLQAFFEQDPGRIGAQMRTFMDSNVDRESSSTPPKEVAKILDALKDAKNKSGSAAVSAVLKVASSLDPSNSVLKEMNAGKEDLDDSSIRVHGGAELVGGGPSRIQAETGVADEWYHDLFRRSVNPDVPPELVIADNPIQEAAALLEESPEYEETVVKRNRVAARLTAYRVLWGRALAEVGGNEAEAMKEGMVLLAEHARRAVEEGAEEEAEAQEEEEGLFPAWLMREVHQAVVQNGQPLDGFLHALQVWVEQAVEAPLSEAEQELLEDVVEFRRELVDAAVDGDGQSASKLVELSGWLELPPPGMLDQNVLVQDVVQRFTDPEFIDLPDMPERFRKAMENRSKRPGGRTAFERHPAPLSVEQVERAGTWRGPDATPEYLIGQGKSGFSGEKPVRRPCRICMKNSTIVLDPMNVPLLLRFMNSAGRIVPRRATGFCAKHQRALSRTVKRAMHLGLFSYKRGRFVARNPFVETMEEFEEGERRDIVEPAAFHDSSAISESVREARQVLRKMGHFDDRPFNLRRTPQEEFAFPDEVFHDPVAYYNDMIKGTLVAGDASLRKKKTELLSSASRGGKKKTKKKRT